MQHNTTHPITNTPAQAPDNTNITNLRPTTAGTPFIKACGQTHATSIDCAAAYGARFIGFVFHRQSPRSITPERAASIPSADMERVGVFVRQDRESILRTMQEARLDYAQLHGNQSTEDADAIGPQRIIRVLWPTQYNNIDELQQDIDTWAPHCAYYLLDSGQRGQGGTGHPLSLEELNTLHFPHPWILAGGIKAENIPTILRHCHPDGLDLNSGIETAPGMKSPVKMLNAFSALAQATLRNSPPYTSDNHPAQTSRKS